MKPHSILKAILSSGLLLAAPLAQAATYYWTNGINANTNWSYGQNWSPNGGPGPGDDTVFTSANAFPTPGLTTIGGGKGAVSLANFNNAVDAGFGGTISSLTYSNSGSAYNNTYLADGVTLNITNLGGFVCGSAQFDFGTATGLTTIAGPNASLTVNNTNSFFFVGFGSASGSPVATLDLSALGTLNVAVSRFMVGAAFTNSTTISHPGGILYLAETNTITAGYQTSAIDTSGTTTGVGAVIVGDSTAQNGSPTTCLYLGQSNYISADTICVARQKTPGSIAFNPNLSGPIATIAGFSSSRVANWIVADGVQNAGTAGPAGTNDFSLGTLNAQVSNLYIGRAGASTSGGGNAVGWFSMGSGTLDVNTLYLGYQPTANTSKTGTGTLNVNSAGGTLLVNGNLYLANCATAGKATGTLNLNGGTASVSNIVAGAGNSTINVFGGKLSIANSAGTASAGLTSLNLSNAIVQVAITAGIAPVIATNVTADYSSTDSTTINVTSLPTIASYPATFTVIQSINGITLQNGRFSFALGSLPAGYTGKIVQGGNNMVEVEIDSSSQVSSVWTGADIPNHNTNWSDTANWSSASAPNGNALVIFNASSGQSASALSSRGGGPGAIVASKINNIANGNFTVAALTYTNTGGTYQNTSIAASDSVTISSGLLTVGSPTKDFGNTTENVTISGPTGTLNVPNAGAFYVSLGTAIFGSAPQATLDLSGLGTLTSSNANFLIGVGGYSLGSYTVPQPSGVAYLAKTNIIYAASAQADSSDVSPVALEVGDADTLAGLPSVLYLGWSNTIHADNIATARQLASGAILFNPSFTNTSPTVYLRGYSASPVANWVIGDGAYNATATLASSGTNDFTGGSIDALANSITVGNSSGALGASGQVAGTLTFGRGIINAGTLNISYNGPASDGNVYDSSVGTVNVNGTGLLVVNTNLNLATVAGIVAYGTTPSGALNIAGGGSVWANTIVPGTNGGSSTISISGGTLIVSNTAGTSAAPLTSLNLTNATMGLAVPYFYGAIEVQAVALNVGGSSNIINILSLPPLASYPTTLGVIQAAGAMSQFNFRLGSLPSGYAGSVSESGDQTTVLLTISSGPVGARPYVLWDGNDSAASLNWSDRLNWQSPGVPLATDQVVFGDVDAASGSPFPGVGYGSWGIANSSAINNIVDGNVTVASLVFTNTEGDYQNTWINNHCTLVTSNLTVGNISNDFGGSATEVVTIAGTNGTLDVNNPADNVYVGLVSATENAVGSGLAVATLDLSGLGTFTASVNTLAVGALSNTSVYPAGVLYLAQTNTITAAGGAWGQTNAFGETLSLMVGETGKGKTTKSWLYLGQMNTFNVNSVGDGLAKEEAAMQFNSTLAGTPLAIFRAADGVSPVSNWAIGDGTGQTGASTSPNGTVDFSAGSVDALVSTMYLGRTPNASANNPSIGTLNLSAGSFNVGTIYDGYQAYTGSDFGVGNINVNGPGTLTISGSLYLAETTSGTGAANTSGTVTINGGSVIVNNIVCDANGVSTIYLNGGTLAVGNTAGTPAAPITYLNLNDGTLLELNVNGSAAVTNLVAASISANGTTTLQIGSLVGVGTSTTYPLISYSGGDPFSSLSLAPLPTGYSGALVDDTAHNLIGLKLTSAAPPISYLAFNKTLGLSGRNVVISGTNQGEGALYVLTSTNVALPRSEWTTIATNVLSGSGSFEFTVTNGVILNAPQQFYMLSNSRN